MVRLVQLWPLLGLEILILASVDPDSNIGQLDGHRRVIFKPIIAKGGLNETENN
jgi:hypothetical protein